MYTHTTRDIRISVQTQFLPEDSDPSEGQYVWAYHIRIENLGDETVTLRHRYWKITDATGRVHEVRGVGVVGEQPTLQPGMAFEYTSGTPLGAPSGFMSGLYEMETPEGDAFEVTVPGFSLDSPYQKSTVQ